MENSLKYFLVTFIILKISDVVVSEFPSEIEKCGPKDNKCLVRTVNNILKNHHKGVDQINLLPLDPLRVDKLDIKQGEGPVNIALNFKDMDFIGFSSTVLSDFKGFDLDLSKMKTQIRAKVKKTSLIGDYQVDGRILVLPITGKGRSNITFENADTVVMFNGKPLIKDGKEYMQVNKLKLTFEKIGRLHMSLEGLFNGDKTLSDNMNVFLNENWELIWTELRVPIEKAFGKVLKNVINNVFAKIPYKELFKSDQ